MLEDGLHPFSSHVREDAPLSAAPAALQNIDGKSAPQQVRPIQMCARPSHWAGSTGDLCPSAADRRSRILRFERATKLDLG